MNGTENGLRKIPTQRTCCYRKAMYAILSCLLYGIAHYLYIPFEPHATFCTDIIGVAIPGATSTLAAVCPTNLESLVPHVITSKKKSLLSKVLIALGEYYNMLQCVAIQFPLVSCPLCMLSLAGGIYPT